MTFTSNLVAVDSHGRPNYDPSPASISAAVSLHVLAFSSQGRLLVAESEGSFDLETWQAIVEEGGRKHRDPSGIRDGRDGVSMESDSDPAIETFVRTLVSDKVAADQHWKEALR